MDTPELILGFLFFASFCINLIQLNNYTNLKHQYKKLQDRFEKAFLSKR